MYNGTGETAICVPQRVAATVAAAEAPAVSVAATTVAAEGTALYPGRMGWRKSLAVRLPRPHAH